MKEATGELNMTVVVIVAVGAILLFLGTFLPKIWEDIQNSWDKSKDTTIQP
jgi:predicted transporter